MNRRPEVVARTRRKLADAFWQLYAERPIGQIGVKEIASLAGCSRSTFYLHFDDVYALRAELANELVARVAAELAALPRESMPEGATIESFARLYVECGEHIYLLVRTDPGFVESLRDVVMSYLGPWVTDREGWERGIALEMAFQALVGGCSFWYEHRDAMPAEDLSPQLHRALHGMLRGCLPA